MKQYIGLIGIIGLLGLIGFFIPVKLFGFGNPQINSVSTTTFTGLVNNQVLFGAPTGIANQSSKLTFNYSSSSLGIGTSTPAYALSVVGDIDVTGTIRLLGQDYGQYFINSAGTTGSLWASLGTGRGGWITTSTLGLKNTDISGLGTMSTEASSTYLSTITAGATYLKLTDTNTSSWDIAYSQTRQWDGGFIGLVSSTARASLWLGTMALQNTETYLTTSTAASTYMTTTTGMIGEMVMMSRDGINTCTSTISNGLITTSTCL